MLNQRICRAGWLALALAWTAAVMPADGPVPPTPEAEAVEPQDADPAADTDGAGPAAPAEGATAGEPARGSPGNPYEAITIRNSFGLREPPPPPPPPQEPPPTVNPTALKLTGITTLLGKRAMFVFNDGKTNKVSDLVREGERDRVITDLEVLEINAVTRNVRVLFGGKEMTMDFVKDGLMPPTNQVALAGGAALRPGTQVAMANVGQRLPGGLPRPAVQVVNTAGAGGPRTIPIRPSRLPSSTLSPTTPGTVGLVGGMPGEGVPSYQGAPSLPTLSPEQQNQLIREQVNFGQQINLEMPPIPPGPGLEDISGPPALPVLPGEMPAFPLPPGPQ